MPEINRNEEEFKIVLQNFFRVAIGCLILMIPVIYVGYLLKIKPSIWGIMSAFICFFISKGIVKKIFWKKTLSR